MCVSVCVCVRGHADRWIIRLSYWIRLSLWNKSCSDSHWRVINYEIATDKCWHKWKSCRLYSSTPLGAQCTEHTATMSRAVQGFFESLGLPLKPRVAFQALLALACHSYIFRAPMGRDLMFCFTFQTMMRVVVCPWVLEKTFDNTLHTCNYIWNIANDNIWYLKISRIIL